MISGAGHAEIEHAGERLALLPQRAVLWGGAKTLFAADLHIGKAAAFRAMGVPAPEQVTRADLARLTGLVEATGVERLVVLGDLLHAERSRAPVTLDALREWRARHASLDIVLVRGNHDLRAGDPPDDLSVACVDPPTALGPFSLVHDPEEAETDAPALAGHVHPAVRLRARSGAPDSMRASCFWRSEGMLVLPAFGRFTGAMRITPARADGVWVVGEDRVVDVSRSPRRRPDAGGVDA